MKKNRFKMSFIAYCLWYFSLYSFILIGIIFAINFFINQKIENMFPSLEDVLKYENYLKKDDFQRIPLKKFKRNEIVIYDEQDTILFYTQNHLKLSINSSDLEFIYSYYDNSNYYIEEFTSKKGNTYYYLIQILNDTSEIELAGPVYAILDEELNIVKGNAFKGRKQLTEREFELLQGLNEGNYIEKYTYENERGEKRSLIFLEPSFDSTEYQHAINRIYSIWLYLIPIVILLELLIMYSFFRRIKKAINPMEELLNTYEKSGVVIYDEREIPYEFSKFFASFQELLANLEKERVKNEQIYKDKQSVITNISHDLKTPLTVIQGYAKAFKDGMVPKGKEEKYMDAIYNKCNIAVQTIDALFEYTQMEHPEYKLHLEHLDFVEFCKTYLANKYIDLELQGYKLVFELPEKVIMKDFDSLLIRRLFDNIIGNSVKYNKKGTTIYFKLVDRGKKVKVILADNGVGVEETTRKNIFLPFVMGDKSRSSGYGTGLGLCIAKRVVDLHHGKIECIEEPLRPYAFEIDILL